MKRQFFYLIVSLFVTCFFFTNPAVAQDFKDTIYYNNQWQICEKPMAESYRVCTLNKTNIIYFKGAFRDYTNNNVLLVEGSYDGLGYKTGLFTYYYINGQIKRQGEFVNDNMQGLWHYYKANGELYFVTNNYSNTEAAFVFAKLKDTVIIKDGNGNFKLNTQDFPEVFGASKLMLLGSCKDSLKEGTWNYISRRNSYAETPTEEYENGIFKSGKISGVTKKKPLEFLFFVPSETSFPEQFLFDVIFGRPRIFTRDDPSAYDKIYQFLTASTKPVIKAKSTSFNNNLVALSALCKDLLKPYTYALTTHNNNFNGTEILLVKVDDMHDYERNVSAEDGLNKSTEVHETFISTITQTENQLTNLSSVNQNLRAHCRFYINKNGTVSKIVIDGNMVAYSSKRLTYLLSRVQGLVPPAKKEFTDIYLYSVANKVHGYPVIEYYLSYYDRSSLH